MKITVLSLDNWGFNKHIVSCLKEKNIEVTHIDFDKFKYVYPSFLHKIGNFLLKLFLGYNIKTNHLHKEITKQLQEVGPQDKILIIKADYLLPKTIKAIKSFTPEFIAFFNDNYNRSKSMKGMLPVFDRVYSFEKNDVERFNLQFITNFIYKENPLNSNKMSFSAFNISSYDVRIRIIEKIALALDKKAPNYKIISVGKTKKLATDTTQIIYTRAKMSLTEVNDSIAQSVALIDVNRKDQHGLTFRVFESLGCHKKLITTNKDIVNYDFYKPENILIIDPENIVIPEGFFTTAYQPIAPEIYNKYGLDYWTTTVLDL